MALSDYPLWRAPLHHEDLEDAEEHVHWVELFYDLIHVVCVFMLGNYLSHHLSIEGFLIFAALFAVIWMAWAEASYFSSLYVSTDVYHRCIMSAQVCTVMRLKRFTPRVAHFSERFALLFLIVMGEGFFKIVIALSEKGVANVSADVLFNFFLSGVIIFTLSWAYFDYVGNGRPHTDNNKHRFRWWYGHLVLMLAAIMIGVAIKAQVQVDFFDKFPLNYAVLSCGGLILFSVSMAIIQSSIERHAGHRYYTRDVQLFGIGMAIITLCSVPFVPAWVGNLLFGIAVISQIAIPMIRAMIAIEKKGEL